MPDIALSHMLGTILLGMLLAAATFFALQTTLDTSFKTSKVYLQEVSERFSAEMVDLLNMFYLEHKSPYIYKTIEVPVHINNKGYIIGLENDSMGWKVVAYLDGYYVFKVESRLYIKEGVHVVNSSGSFDVENGRIVYADKIYSGTSKPVIWCKRDPVSGMTQIGIGRLEVGG
ncbi:MAG: hypothetical protein ACPLZF_05090 [Nitrososphaeria archaeon]